MKFNKTKIDGVYIIDCFDSNDNRGSFTKIFNADEFKRMNLCFEYKELFYTTSNKGVIRAMHFNVPPITQIKLVSCIEGHVIDVILDLRKSSKTYLKYIEIDLNARNKKAIYIPVGCAHGYKSLENGSKVIYYSSCSFSKDCDSGIFYNSFGYNWKINNPIISDRDKNLIFLEKFNNPF